MLEIDCHVTKDGHVVVSHDNNLQRVSGEPVIISDTDYKDIPLLMPQLRLEFQQSHVTTTGTDQKVALLKDLFDNFPNTPINIDIKINNNVLIRKVSELVKEYGRESLTIWGNRSSIITEKCYAENPDILLLFSMRRVLITLGLFYTGLLPFVPIREAAFEIPMPNIMLKLLKSDKFRKLNRSTGEMQLGLAFRILIRLADFLLVNKSFFSHLRRRGIQTYLWVLNDEDDFERAFKHGATGVMTDFPTKLKGFLERRDAALQADVTTIPLHKMAAPDTTTPGSTPPLPGSTLPPPHDKAI